MDLKYANTDEVLHAMRMGVEYVFEIHVRNFIVQVRPISVSETLHVASDVARDLSLMARANPTPAHEAYLIALYTLQRASRIPFDSKIEGPLQKATIDLFTTAELLALFEQYRDGCERVNPSLEVLSDDKLTELAEHAKKNPAILTQLSRRLLETLAHYSLTKENSPQDK